MNNQVQFKNVEPRLLGPMSLLVQGNNNETAKGIDLVLPAFSWALDMKIFLPVPEALLRSNANEGYRCINQDIEYFLFSPPIMCLSIRFNDQFYKKYKDSVDPESAYDILTKRINEKMEADEQLKHQETEQKLQKDAEKSQRTEKSTMEKVMSSPITRQIGTAIVRGLFGMLTGKRR